MLARDRIWEFVTPGRRKKKEKEKEKSFYNELQRKLFSGYDFFPWIVTPKNSQSGFTQSTLEVSLAFNVLIQPKNSGGHYSSGRRFFNKLSTVSRQCRPNYQ